MCKEMPVIPVNRVVDTKRIIEKWRAEEEERHKGLLSQKHLTKFICYVLACFVYLEFSLTSALCK
jgi:hypothetical protein